jgi:hypothetical protein
MMPPGWPISHVGSSSLFGASILIFAALLFSSQLALAQFTQQGPKLVGREKFCFAVTSRAGSTRSLSDLSRASPDRAAI